MKQETFTFKAPDGVEVFVYKWLPDGKDIKGIVQIAHGMAENAARYERFARFLNKKGYAVYANDHRGHGKTAKTINDVGYLGEDGFDWMVKDMKQLNDIISSKYPNKDIFLFGHSMGSLLGQRYISIYGDSIKGVILSGTSGKQGPILNIGIGLANMEVRIKGARAKSKRLDRMMFGSYNKGIKNPKTKFDWLSRDAKEVAKYVENPYCGGVFTTGFFYDFLVGFKKLHIKEHMNKVPKDLPIFIFSGMNDPVGKNCKTVKWLVDEYKNIGIEDVSYKFYEDGRHEMLNEINRDEVMNNTVMWIDKHLEK